MIALGFGLNDPCLMKLYSQNGVDVNMYTIRPYNYDLYGSS